MTEVTGRDGYEKFMAEASKLAAAASRYRIKFEDRPGRLTVDAESALLACVSEGPRALDEVEAMAAEFSDAYLVGSS